MLCPRKKIRVQSRPAGICEKLTMISSSFTWFVLSKNKWDNIVSGAIQVPSPSSLVSKSPSNDCYLLTEENQRCMKTEVAVMLD